MSVSARSFLIPAAALATAGAVALTPAVTAAPTAAPVLPAAAVPAIHIEEIQLAGIGREIYDSITNFVQYTVSSAEFWIDLIPIIGPPLADQLNINYFEGIQPLIAATVYVISDLIADPFNFLPLAVAYGENLFYTGYNWFSAQLQFFGLPGLAPIPVPPPLASESPAGRGAAAAIEAQIEVAVESLGGAPATPDPDAATKAAVDFTVVHPGSRAGATRGDISVPRPGRVAAPSAATDPAAPVTVPVDAEASQDAAQSAQTNSGRGSRGVARSDRSDANHPGQSRR